MNCVTRQRIFNEGAKVAEKAKGVNMMHMNPYHCEKRDVWLEGYFSVRGGDE